MIGGLDPSGCAGLALDVRVAHALGVHACPIATTLTAQTPWGWRGAWAASPAAVRAQIDAAMASFRIGAVKIGMLGDAANIRAIADALDACNNEKSANRANLPVVLDPVLATSSGGARVDDEGLDALLGALWPRATVATPNRPEAEALAGMTIADDASRDAVAKRLLAGGAKNVVIKGGHDDGEESVDHWYDGKAYRRLTAPRRVGPSVRGTGCVFASALAAGLALGKSLADALVCAKEFVTRFVEDPLAAGPVGIGQLPIHAEA